MQLIIVEQLVIMYNMYRKTWSITDGLLYEICINHFFWSYLFCDIMGRAINDDSSYASHV